MQQKITFPLYLLLSNAVLMYGLLEQDWPLFPIIFLWWWEGIINYVADRFIRRLRKTEAAAPGFPLFVYFIYLVFIIVLAGFMGAANDDQILINLQTLMLHNPLFNISLLLLFVYQGLRILSRDIETQGMLSFWLQIRLHVAIVFGGLGIFLARQFDWHYPTAILVAFLTVKIVMDYIAWRKG